MLYSLKKVYAKQVLKEGVEPVIQQPTTEDESVKVQSILTTSLRNIVNLIDKPSEDLEGLLGEIREQALTALIDSGFEKD